MTNGYRGSAQTVYRYVRPFRAGRTTPAVTVAPSSPAAPKIRYVAGRIMRDPQNLSDTECLRLKEILARCPGLEAARRHVGGFASMIRDLAGDRLPGWMDRVRAGFPLLRKRILHYS